MSRWSLRMRLFHARWPVAATGLALQSLCWRSTRLVPVAYWRIPAHLGRAVVQDIWVNPDQKEGELVTKWAVAAKRVGVARRPDGKPADAERGEGVRDVVSVFGAPAVRRLGGLVRVNP